MQHRKLPSHLFSLKRILVVALTCLALPAHAENGGLLSLFAQEPAAAAPARDEPLAVQELRPAPPISAPIDLTAPTDDLWLRVRNGFAMPDLNDDLVLRHQQWYLSRPESLRRMVDRSRRYLHHIVEELEKRGMPTELALLPMVESAFNPMALSRSQASGLWQFIPSTGKTYRLEQNWWQDQRRDIVASTTAALDYLQTIYEMHGDWHLALASYNWGENAVKRAIQKNEAKGLPTDYLSLTMPAETRNYVPKLQALKNIFGNPKLIADLKIPALDNRPYFTTVETGRLMDVRVAAKLAGMPVDEFVALNPSHNRPVIKADAPLAIPADKVEAFQANLENHSAPLASWQAYTLKPGERLDKVAPRFGISLADLKRINGLQGKLKTEVGSTLLVPANGEAKPDDIDAVAAQPRPPEIPAQPSPRKAVAETHGGKPGKADKTPAAKYAKAVKGKTGKLLAKAETASPVRVAAKADKAKGGKLAAARDERKPAAKVAGSASKPGAKVAAGKGKAEKKAVAAKPSHSSAAKFVRADNSRRA